jgi:hypothetical protein
VLLEKKKKRQCFRKKYPYGQSFIPRINNSKKEFRVRFHNSCGKLLLIHLSFCHFFPQKLQFRQIWDRCYDFKNIFDKNFSKNIGVLFAQTSASFCKNVIITLVFEKNGIFSRRKLAKIVIITSTPGHRRS